MTPAENVLVIYGAETKQALKHRKHARAHHGNRMAQHKHMNGTKHARHFNGGKGHKVAGTTNKVVSAKPATPTVATAFPRGGRPFCPCPEKSATFRDRASGRPLAFNAPAEVPGRTGPGRACGRALRVPAAPAPHPQRCHPIFILLHACVSQSPAWRGGR
jgi:hypothetical protein